MLRSALRRSSGRGKSAALLVDAIRYVGRGYGSNYRALLLRRTYPELKRTLIDKSHGLYPRLGGRWRETDKTWTFPGGEIVEFGHIEHEDDVFIYQGAEYQFIGLDELTSFTRKQYIYLISRLRSAVGIPLRIRAATNPGNEGHDWVYERWGAWLNPDYVGPKAEPGRVRYFKRSGGESDNELPAAKGESGARGRCFVPALLSDNPFLAADGEYARNLEELDPVTKRQLRDGNWLIRPGKGLYFKRTWITFIDEMPKDVRLCRFWDRAATEKTPDNDPDWTRGVLGGVTVGGDIIVANVQGTRSAPGTVKQLIRSTAECDTTKVVVGLSQDPAAAGVFEIEEYKTELQGFRVETLRESTDKITRFGPFSSQAEPRTERSKGRVYIVRGDWNNDYITELEAFPEGRFDDQVDATSGFYAVLVGKRNPMAEALLARVAREKAERLKATGT